MKAKCPLCDDTGIYKNEVCICVLKTIFDQKCPHLVNTPKSQNLLNNLLKGKISLDKNYLVKKSYQDANELIATYAIYRLIKDQRLDIGFSNCIEAQDLIFDDGSSITQLEKPDILVYTLLGIKHKALPTFLYQAFQVRMMKNKQTFLLLANPKAGRSLHNDYADLAPIISEMEEIK